jgi:hypothetical protein
VKTRRENRSDYAFFASNRGQCMEYKQVFDHDPYLRLMANNSKMILENFAGTLSRGSLEYMDTSFM